MVQPTGRGNVPGLGLLAILLAFIIMPAAAQPPAPPIAALPAIEARAGDHAGYLRLVFDWPGPVGYGVEKQGGRAVITFTKPGKIDAAALRSGLSSDVTLGAVDNSAKGLSVVLQVPANSRLRHFTTGNKIVIDVVRAADAAAPDDSGKVPLAPPPGADVAPPTASAAATEKPKTPAEALSAGRSPVKPTLVPKDKSAPPSPPAAALPAAVTAPTPAAVSPPPLPTKTFSLSIAMTRPAAAAVFERAGYLWILLDRRQEIDTVLLQRLGGEAVLSVEQLPNKDATILRLVVRPDYYPSVRKDGLLWVVDLTQQSVKPKDLIPVTAPATLPSGIGMSLRAPDSGSLISVTDPAVGDTLKVVPVIPLSQGIYPGRDTPDLELLPTAQGIVIIPHVDGLDIRSTRGGVTIGMLSGAGLRFSSELDTAPRDATTAAGNGGLFDIGAWKRGGPDNFGANSKVIAAGLAGVSVSRRALANLQAARFYFANGYAAEAVGYLKLAAIDQPDLADQPGFKAMKGGAELLLAQYDLARSDLDSPLLQNDPEVQMWRGAAHTVDVEDPADQDKPMAAGLPAIKAYPHRLKWRIAALAAQAAIAAGDDQAASQALSFLDREDADKRETPERDYLHGAYDQMAGHFEKAIDEYDSAAEGENRQYRALAKFAETELSLKTRKISPKEAAEQLDKLRFSWREQAFEFNLLLRYATLQREGGDYPAALRALRSLVSYYPDDKDTPKAVKLMSDIFNMLYLDGQADSMPPVSAIGLYDEFRDLTPTGPQGDEMIRKLADRLAKVDLLDRAGELLKHQVVNRLQGVDKARVGAQLALLDLMNQQPQAALDGLGASETTPQSEELKRQRRELRARALSDLDHTDEAIAALDGDKSPEAMLLRSEIHWKAKDWSAAAADFQTMLPKPERDGTLDDAGSKIALSWATALVLDNDERSLAALRRNYGAAMAGTPYHDAFTLLTSALDRQTPDMRDVIGKIKEVEGFKSFLSDYRKRVQASGVSGIN